ncbi:MAG TPA: hypothetical protein VLA89_07835 [Gemmatimonadales bacterium]|nr:hypothetical protein [Gemmatimonadales bacterium]
MSLPELRYFKPSEFRHGPLVDAQCALYLDQVRHECGFPLYVIDDARMPEDRPPGSSPSSLHYAGRAFDLKWIQPATKLYHFVDVAMRVAAERRLNIELELVNSLKDRHVHLGVQKFGVESELIVASD